MKLLNSVIVLASAVIASSAAGQASYTLQQNFTASPSGYYCGSTSGYFYSIADVEGPGSSTQSAIGGCTWGANVTYSGSGTPTSSVPFVVQFTDEATAYYYLRGSASYPTSGSVDALGESTSYQTVEADPGVIYQTSTTQTATIPAGPTAIQYSGTASASWTYNSVTMSWTSTISLYHATTSAYGELVAPTNGNTKANEAEGYAEDNCRIISISPYSIS